MNPLQDGQKDFRQGRSERKPEEVQTALRAGRSAIGLILANGKAPQVLPTSENRIWYVEGLSEVRTKPESFFTILGLTDGHHAVECDLRPILLIIRNDDLVHDVAVGKVLHRPAEMGSIDPEHRRALADRG